MRRISFVLVGTIVTAWSVSAAAQTAPAQTPQEPRFWERTMISFGFNTYSGNSDSKSLDVRLDSTLNRGRLESDTNVDVDFSQSEGQAIFNRERLDSALRYGLTTRNRWFYLIHVWLEQHETSGINFRGSAGPGLGVHLIDGPKGRVTLEGGIAATTEKPTRGQDVNFATLFFDPTVRWSLTKQTSLQQKVKFRYNLEESDDTRIHSESNLDVQITERFGIQFGVTIDYDNQPVEGHKTTDVQTYTNLSVTLHTPGH